MNRNSTVLIMFAMFAVVLAAISCSKSGGPASSMLSSASAPRMSPDANDYTKPYLTDDKMQKFLTSMQEEHNPLELVFKKGGQVQNPMDLASRLEEFNSYARKYGFADYQDYTIVWGRIMAGEMQMVAADMVKGSTQMFQKTIDDAQADLKKPNLTPEQKKFDEDQIAGAQQTLSELSKTDSKSALNDSDMALVKKYKDQLDAAEKKFDKKQ